MRKSTRNGKIMGKSWDFLISSGFIMEKSWEMGTSTRNAGLQLGNFDRTGVAKVVQKAMTDYHRNQEIHQWSEKDVLFRPEKQTYSYSGYRSKSCTVGFHIETAGIARCSSNRLRCIYRFSSLGNGDRRDRLQRCSHMSPKVRRFCTASKNLKKAGDPSNPP